MSIFRDRELKLFLALLLIIGTTQTVACFFISISAGILSGCGSMVFIMLIILFTRRRYNNIARLNGYLKRVNSGDYALDLRDNTEGELSILRNELYKVTVMLREQNENLQQDKIKMANAMSDISHQLKTPLTSMFMMTDLLCESGLPDSKRIEFTGRLRAQLERINWLVASLLKFSKLDAGTVEFNRRKITINELLDKACAALAIPIELKNQSLSLPDCSGDILCDLNWTSEALLNILKNCMEHTPQNGQIGIGYSDNPLYTQITISDNGPGIDPNDLPYIFNRFYRGRNASPDNVGIGLAMAATIIQGQGGSISVQSSGAGSAFTIRFPQGLIQPSPSSPYLENQPSPYPLARQ